MQNIQRGFTLIELMIVVVIVAIIASIAIPSYRYYVKKTNEEKAKQRLLSLSNELESWSSNTFSYRGFVPTGGYNDNDKKVVYLPKGTGSSSDYMYKITLVDATGSTIKSLTEASASGRLWRMKAEPNRSKLLLGSAKAFYLDALKKRCSFNVGASVALNKADSSHMCDVTTAKSW